MWEVQISSITDTCQQLDIKTSVVNVSFSLARHLQSKGGYKRCDDTCRHVLVAGVRTARSVPRAEEEQAAILLLDHEHDRYQGREGA